MTAFDVIIAAGGRGKRMNSELPKQFMAINGKPVIVHTIEKFITAIPEAHFIVAMHPDWQAHWKEIRKALPADVLIHLTDGGAERYHSIKQALTMVQDDSIVCIHDAARPMVSTELIKRCIADCVQHSTAVPAVPVTESIRQVIGDRSVAVDRNDFLLIQTPQCFLSHVIRQSYRQPFQQVFTDDASVAEAAGFTIHITKGEYGNIKITTPEDLDLVHYRMNKHA